MRIAPYICENPSPRNRFIDLTHFRLQTFVLKLNGNPSFVSLCYLVGDLDSDHAFDAQLATHLARPVGVLARELRHGHEVDDFVMITVVVVDVLQNTKISCFVHYHRTYFILVNIMEKAINARTITFLVGEHQRESDLFLSVVSAGSLAQL